jgi:hypothetical protein
VRTNRADRADGTDRIDLIDRIDGEAVPGVGRPVRARGVGWGCPVVALR